MYGPQSFGVVVAASELSGTWIVMSVDDVAEELLALERVISGVRSEAGEIDSATWEERFTSFLSELRDGPMRPSDAQRFFRTWPSDDRRQLAASLKKMRLAVERLGKKMPPGSLAPIEAFLLPSVYSTRVMTFLSGQLHVAWTKLTTVLALSEMSAAPRDVPSPRKP